MIKKIIYRLCLLRNKIFDRDDFNWEKYHQCYENEIKECAKVNTLRLKKNDLRVDENRLEFYCRPSLHNNAEFLYRIIHDLNPESISEVGCGGGDHMYNLKRLMPYKLIAGYDLLEKQLDFLKERNPGLSGNVFVHDITKGTIPYAELIYTQAVIMHIQKGDRHLDALKNMIDSSKYVVLMENWKRHNFFDDVLKVASTLLYVYKVDNGKQVAMVISHTPIKNKKLDYIELKNNEEMLKYL